MTPRAIEHTANRVSLSEYGSIRLEVSPAGASIAGVVSSELILKSVNLPIDSKNKKHSRAKKCTTQKKTAQTSENKIKLLR